MAASPAPQSHQHTHWEGEFDRKVQDYYDFQSEGKKAYFPHTYLLRESLSVVLWRLSFQVKNEGRINIALTAPTWSLG